MTTQTTDATRFDVVTIGETMLRLTPPDSLRLGQGDVLHTHVGGSESNTAVGLAKLGRRVAWLSRLTDNPMGRSIEQTIRAHGADTSHVVWTNSDRVGLYFLENGSPPRPSQVIYDRAGSAFSKYDEEMLPDQLFQPSTSRWLHLTGITLGLGETTQRLVRKAVRLARNASWKISFDVNYRALLWSTASAKDACNELFESADLLFLAERDARNLWQIDGEGDPHRSMRQLLAIRSGKTTVMTLGSQGAIAGEGDDSVLQTIEPVHPIGRLGGGDAFSAGFLHAWIEDTDLKIALSWAAAAARIKYSIPGDLPLFEKSEVQRIVNAGSEKTDIQR
ncbi:MAG: sugar kinase [Pirellula sp.]|nr:sugar kinase [Pirellula sp.]